MKKELASHRKEKSLSCTGLEELLPLFCVSHREGDGVDAELEPHSDRVGPEAQLQAEQHKRPLNTKQRFFVSG